MINNMHNQDQSSRRCQ